MEIDMERIFGGTLYLHRVAKVTVGKAETGYSPLARTFTFETDSGVVFTVDTFGKVELEVQADDS